MPWEMGNSDQNEPHIVINENNGQTLCKNCIQMNSIWFIEKSNQRCGSGPLNCYSILLCP